MTTIGYGDVTPAEAAAGGGGGGRVRKCLFLNRYFFITSFFAEIDLNLDSECGLTRCSRSGPPHRQCEGLGERVFCSTELRSGRCKSGGKGDASIATSRVGFLFQCFFSPKDLFIIHVK